MKASRLMVTIREPKHEKQLKFINNLKKYLEKNELGYVHSKINNDIDKSISLDLRLLDSNKSFVRGYIKRHYGQNKNIELSNFSPTSSESLKTYLNPKHTEEEE